MQIKLCEKCNYRMLTSSIKCSLRYQELYAKEKHKVKDLQYIVGAFDFEIPEACPYSLEHLLNG